MNKMALALVGILFFSGCASKQYAWNGYDSGLYAFYKNPEDREKFVERLERIIEKAEKTKNVPPGIYAEYGYMLYEDQKLSEAIVYFEKERDAWPESGLLMEK